MFKAHLTNYRGFLAASLDLGDGVTVLVGPNSAGKTGLCNGIAAALAEAPKIYGVTKESAKTEILSKGCPPENLASVVLSTGSGCVTAIWPEGRIATNGDGPFPRAGAVASGLLNPRRLDKRAWAKFVAQLAKIGAVTETEIRDGLVAALQAAHASREDVDAAVVAFRARAGDFDAVEAEYRDKATKAKGVWEHLTGERYGADKARDWRAPGGAAVDPDLRARYDATQQELDRLSADVRKKASAYGAMPDGHTGFTDNCPACGVVLALEGKKLVEHTAEIDAELARQRDAKAAAGQELEALSTSEQQARTTLLELRAQIAAAEATAARGAETENLARSEHQKVEKFLKIADFFSEKGFRLSRMAEALKPINARLAELGDALFGADRPDNPPVISPEDLELRFGGRTQGVIAWGDDENSTSTRLRYILQILAWERLGGDLIIMDRADILEARNRVRLLKTLKRIGAPALVVIATDQPERATGFLSAGMADRVYAVTRGQVDRLAAPVQEEAA